MKRRKNRIRRIATAVFLLSVFPGTGPAAELRLQLQYPTKTNDFILTGVEDGFVVFRPTGRDSGGRAYLAIDELESSRARLNFLFPEEFYDAVETVEDGSAYRALPVIRRYALPFLDYMSLSGLPGNMLPVVISYLDVLAEAGEWTEATDVAVRIPLEVAPPFITQRVANLVESLSREGRQKEIDRLHRHIISSGKLSTDRLEVLMELAEFWRKNEEYEKAFDLYRKVQGTEGPFRKRARLWKAYCSIYLGREGPSDLFLQTLPELEPLDPGYSLGELVKALIYMNEGDASRAMRLAAIGKTYANAAEPWYPELLHRVAVLYGDLGLDEASLFAHREVSTLYPNTLWGGKSSRILNESNL